jgi:hypothetical protein
LAYNGSAIAKALPFSDASFDGVLLNVVLDRSSGGAARETDFEVL